MKNSSIPILYKIIEWIFFIFIISVSLSAPYLIFELHLQLLVGIFLFILIYFIFRLNKPLFVPSLFFVIYASLRPITLILIRKLSFSFPQIDLIPSVAIYLLSVLIIPSLRKDLLWLKVGKVSKKSVGISVFVVVFSALSLILWATYSSTDLSRFTEYIPKLPFFVLIIYGIFFALINSLTEEFLARAVLYDGFTFLTDNTFIITFLQALVFSIWHINGFPGGLTGAFMVFVWSLSLGYIRYNTSGILTSIVVHFFADLTIAIIMYFLFVY